MFYRTLRTSVFLLTLVGLCLPRLSVSRAFAQTTGTPESKPAVILSPLPGEALQGNVPVMVTIQDDTYQKAELFFGYTGDPSGAWFPLAVASIPLHEQSIVLWDTTTISDGDYSLFLSVTRADGSIYVAQVAGVRVRNYTQVETPTTALTATAVPGAPTDTPIPPTPTITPVPPTPTALPANPAEITLPDVATSAASGVLAVAGFLAVLGLYIKIRQWRLDTHKHRRS